MVGSEPTVEGASDAASNRAIDAAASLYASGSVTARLRWRRGLVPQRVYVTWTDNPRTAVTTRKIKTFRMGYASEVDCRGFQA